MRGADWKRSMNGAAIMRRSWLIGAVAAALGAWPVSLPSQGPVPPFGAGERMTFRIRVDRMHASGRATMWIEGPIDFRGTTALLLRSDIQLSIGPIKASNRSESWLDPQRMTALRYHKWERHFLRSSDESVDIFPEERTWRSSLGPSGSSLTDAPLDELSFIYFVRTLALGDDRVLSLNRHYDPSRNPVEVRVAGRDTIATTLGTFRVVIAEMRVRDPGHYRGDGVIRIALSDDALRVPIRIESMIPGAGVAVFTLETYASASGHMAAGSPTRLSEPSSRVSGNP